MISTRRLAVLAIAAFALIQIYKDPAGSGGYVHDLIALVAGVVLSVFRFFGAAAV